MSIIRKIGKKLKKTSLKDKIVHTIFKLEEQKEKLEDMASKLQERDQEMFNKCVEAQISSDIARSKVYANECAEIKKIAKIVLTSQLALERVIVRLQTVEEFGEILMQIVPVMDVVSETKGQIAGIIPEVSSELEDVNNMLHDMSLETGEADSYDPSIGPISDDAAKVLHESSLVAEEMMKEKFPEPKVNASNVVVLQEGAEPVELENLLIKYIENHEGKLSLSNCSSELGMPVQKIKNVISKLVDQGKIEMT